MQGIKYSVYGRGSIIQEAHCFLKKGSEKRYLRSVVALCVRSRRTWIVQTRPSRRSLRTGAPAWGDQVCSANVSSIKHEMKYKVLSGALACVNKAQPLTMPHLQLNTPAKFTPLRSIPEV